MATETVRCPSCGGELDLASLRHVVCVECGWTSRSEPAPVEEREALARLLHTLDCETDAPEDEDPSLYAQWWESDACNRQQYYERADRILARSRSPEPTEVGWRPIETAPKDETKVVLLGTLRCNPDFGVRACVSQWCERDDVSPYYMRGWPFVSPGLVDEFHPTHWMPLPAAPSTADEPVGGSDA